MRRRIIAAAAVLAIVGGSFAAEAAPLCRTNRLAGIWSGSSDFVAAYPYCLLTISGKDGTISAGTCTVNPLFIGAGVQGKIKIDRQCNLSGSIEIDPLLKPAQQFRVTGRLDPEKFVITLKDRKGDSMKLRRFFSVDQVR